MYYHVLEDGGNGNIGHQGVYDTQEEAQNRADELTDMFSNSEFYVEASDSEDEPYSVTSSDYDPDMDFNEGKEVEPSLYENNPLEGGPGYMTKYRIGVLSTLISDAEKDIIKYEGSSFFTPELIEKMKGTVENLKSSREDLEAQYEEEIKQIR
jgi:hypothetical protein